MSSTASDQYSSDAEEEMDVDDAELQMALMMSMQQEQPADQGPNAAGQAAAPAQVAAPAPQPGGAMGAVNQAQMQQALMQALQSLQQAAAGAPPPANAPGGSPPAARAARHAAQPSWVQPAQDWAALNALPDSSAVPGPAAAGSALADAFSAALGTPVALTAPGTVPGATAIPLASDGSGGFKLSASAVDAALARSPAGGGGDPVLGMQACWARAGAAAAAAPEAAGALQLLQTRAARRAAQVLENDEDDLFFEGGKARTTLLSGLESGQVSPAFVDAMAATAATPAEAKTWEGVLRDACAAFSSFSFARPEAHEGALRRLDALTQGPALRRCLAAALVREAAAAGAAGRGGRPRGGKALQSESLLAPLLAVSTLPTYGPQALLPLRFPAAEALQQLRNYPRQRGSQVDSEVASMRRSLTRAQAAAHEVCRRVATLKAAPGGGAPAGREAVPAWLAAVSAANLPRAAAGSYLDRVLHHRRAVFDSSSDGFLVGALAVALRSCRPFMASADKMQAALAHLDPSFYSTQAHRVVGAREERALGGSFAGGAPGEGGEGPGEAPYPAVSPDRGEGAAPPAPHFIAEMFFATQRLLRVGLVPAVYRCQALTKLLKQQRGRGGGDDDDDDDDDGGGFDDLERGATLEEWMLADSVRAALLEPELAADVAAFCELTARWVLSLLRRDPRARAAALALVPESAVRDACAALQFLIGGGAAEVLGGVDIGALVSCLVQLLRATEAVPSPAVHYSVVQLLLSMLSPQLGGGRRHLAPAEAALVASVLGAGAAQLDLLPALMAAYVHADHVVGLDVDKDAYDKFHMRTCVDLLLLELWRDPTCAASMDAAAAAPAHAALLADFCGAVLNDLLYLLKDSLGRLADIAALERSMADAAAWAAQPPAERAAKEDFYRSQQRAAGGFMSQAVTTLRMLNALAGSAGVRRGFGDERVVGRAAGAAFHFIDLLEGPRRGDLGVERPEQYRFDPGALLLGVVQFTLRLAEQPAFVGALAAAPDYDGAIMAAAARALAERGLGGYEHRARLEGLIEAVAESRRASAGGGQGGGGGGAAAAAGGGGGAALDLSLPGLDPGEGLEAAYSAALTPLAVGDFDAAAPRAYNRAFAAMADAPAGDTSTKVRRVGREMRDLRGKMSLPVYAAGAILVRHDGERLDKVRACVTGPEGTPYAGGCFFFDVWFPAEYPSLPPLMELETTGGGVARFNPNLYADGKVCLSLLGTWHGGHESEKWSPATSSLWQVLLSIQGMIFIAEPYHNEPSYDGMRGTAEGAAASLRYNADIWLNTIRYAMVDVLRRPRPGFEAAITAHFRLLRHRIMRQAAAWVEQAAALDATFQRRLREAVAELRGLLAEL